MRIPLLALDAVRSFPSIPGAPATDAPVGAEKVHSGADGIEVAVVPFEPSATGKQLLLEARTCDDVQ